LHGLGFRQVYIWRDFLADLFCHESYRLALDRIVGTFRANYHLSNESRVIYDVA